MRDDIEREYMVFLAEGEEGIGAVHDVTAEALSVYVENFGEFFVPRRAVKSVHDQKVVLDRALVSRKFLRAVQYARVAEDQRLVG